MRYLYGDSVPFPPQYDFLAALDAFCTHAARVVRLDAETRALKKTAEESASTRARAVEQLDAFHREAVEALQEGARESTEPLIQDYVRQVGDLAQRIADEAKRSAQSARERDAAQLRAEGDRRRAELRDALERLFVAVRLPVSETEITMTLADGRNDFTAVFTHEAALVATFTLGAEDLDGWRAPRQVRELAQGVTLPVGVKRSLFKRTVAPETITLDDYLLSGFDLRDDSAELRLRRKLEHPDSLVFTLRRVDDRLTVEVHHPDDAEADSGLPSVLDQSSAVEVERLWQLLRAACGPVLSRKRRLMRLSLAGDEVVEHDLGTEVVALLVGALAPVVAEVARRSPNAHELSLKVENEGGRREEIYLRKAQLVSALATVAPKARRVFDPLGLIASDPRDTIESISDDVGLGE